MKNKIYILIIVIMIGINIPISKINAQCSVGINPDISAEDCEKIGGVSGPVIPIDEKKPTGPATNGDYILLQPLPCEKGTQECENGKLIAFNPSGAGKLGTYLNFAIRLFIGLCAVAAVVMIVIGGIEWSTSELISGKEAGKERIWQAIMGLLLALGSWTLLYTINPDLLNTDVDVGGASINSEGELTVKDLKEIITTSGTSGTGGAIDITSVGTVCDARKILSTAQSNGYSITPAQADTFACLAKFESQGCKSTTNYSWGKGSSAYGAFQITLQSNSKYLENKTCYAAAGITGPLRCSAGFRSGNPIPTSSYYQQCIKAANNFACNLSAAVGLMKNRPSFGDWTADPHCKAMGSRCPQAQCIAKFNH